MFNIFIKQGIVKMLTVQRDAFSNHPNGSLVVEYFLWTKNALDRF